MTVAIPPGILDSDAIRVALSRLPRRLEKEYRGKLERLEFGTILELALLGRLLQNPIPFDVLPWPDESRVDAHLGRGARTLEVEIKSSIQTRYDENVHKMCQVIREKVEKRWPTFRGDINLFNDFREIDCGGSKTLDVKGTVLDVMTVLDEAISPEGDVRPEYREHVPFRLVTKIEPLSYVRVWLSSWRLPGGHGEEVARRTLKRALDDEKQFSGRTPAILAVIQARDPDSRLLYEGCPSVADEFFKKHADLSAIISLPCPSLNGPAVVITPHADLQPTRQMPLRDDEPQQLARLFAVRLQVNPVWIGLEEELRKQVKDGSYEE